MTQDELKILVGRAALDWVVPGEIVGVGTGSTVNKFIDALADIKHIIKGAVSSSEQSTQRLRSYGITVFEAQEINQIPVYIDGADEIDHQGFMIKGGGAALTREKIVADLANKFICIADESKRVATLGQFPLPVEVIDMASAQIIRLFKRIGGDACIRPGVLTDNGHPILDVRGLVINDPIGLEAEINQWPGVVSVGIFARNKASVCLIGGANGIETIQYT